MRGKKNSCNAILQSAKNKCNWRMALSLCLTLLLKYKNQVLEY